MLPTSSSDSDSELEVSNFQGIVDSSLLCDSMFAGNNVCKNESQSEMPITTNTENLLSQRYLEADSSMCYLPDVIVSAANQEFLAKKFSKLIEKIYECSNLSPEANRDVKEASKRRAAIRSRIKLLSDANCYIEDEEPQSNNNPPEIIPRRKIEVKRRAIEGECGGSKQEKQKIWSQLAVEGTSILNGSETKHWSSRKERKSKIFHYKQDTKDGILMEVPEVNEFTSLRKKNNWDESKIRDYAKNNKRAAQQVPMERLTNKE